MRIVWLVNNINQVGGIEQVVCGLSQYFSCELDHQVEIISINSAEGRPFFPLHESVTVRHCGLHWRDQTPKKRRQIIRGILPGLNADILLTCHGGISTEVLLYKHAFRGKVVVTQHSACDSFSWKWRLANILLFRFADAFVVLTKADQRFYRKALCRATVIPNAMLSAFSGCSDLKNPMLVAAGRLTEIKGFDQLIDAFAMIAPAHPEWKLCICGDGELMDTLKQQADSHGLSDRILFPGFVSITDRMRSAGGFVLSSRSEGFPLVLLEALTHGLPVVAYELPAVKEICGSRGVLTAACGDTAALAEKMDQLLSSEQLRNRLSEEAIAVSQQYTVAAVAEKWMDLFRQLLQ